MKSFEVRNKKIEGILREIGRTLKNKLPTGWGFMRFLFSFGEGKKKEHVSAPQRQQCQQVCGVYEGCKHSVGLRWRSPQQANGWGSFRGAAYAAGDCRKF